MSTFSSWSPEKAAAISAKNRAARGILAPGELRYESFPLAVADGSRCLGSELIQGREANAPLVKAGSIPAKGAKYKNVKVSVDGEIVDSRKEAKRRAHLRLLARGGFIQQLAFGVEFYLRAGDQHVCVYRADAVYTDNTGKTRVEDTKSEVTRKLPMYRQKKRLMQVCLGIEVEEV